MNEVDRIFKSEKMKTINADKAKLGMNARAMYLAGRVRLSMAEDVARSADRGRGFTIRSLVPEKVEKTLV